MEFEQIHKDLATAYDSGHDFLLGSRVGKEKAGEETNDTTKSIKKSVAATILLDFIQKAQPTPFPTTESAAEERIKHTKKVLNEAAGITAFDEDHFMERLESIYNVLLGTGGKHGDYPTLSYKDLLTVGSASASPACLKALAERNIALPNEVFGETDERKLGLIKQFIEKFYGIRELNIAADAAPQNVFKTFLDNDLGVKFALNWANKFDPAGGISTKHTTVDIAPQIESLSVMPGSDFSKDLGKADPKFLMNLQSTGQEWDQDESKHIALMRVGNKTWYEISPVKKSPGVPDISKMFILKEGEKGPEAPNKGVQSPRLMREALGKILKEIIPGKTPKDQDLKRRFYVAFFMDLKEAGDRAQIYWISKFSTADKPYVFLTNDRMCSMLARMYKNVDVALATAHKLHLFKAFNKGAAARPSAARPLAARPLPDRPLAARPVLTNSPVDNELQRKYEAIVQKMNDLNYVYGFTTFFAENESFKPLLDHLELARTIRVKPLYELEEIAAIIPSLFVSLHACERRNEIINYVKQIEKVFSRISEVGTELQSKLKLFKQERRKILYFQIKPFDELNAVSKTDKKFSDILANLTAYSEDEDLQNFKEKVDEMNYQIEYKDDTIVIGGQDGEAAGFWKSSPKLNELQFNKAESSLYRFYERGGKVLPGLMTTKVVEIQDLVLELAAITNERLKSKKKNDVVKQLEMLGKFFIDKSPSQYEYYDFVNELKKDAPLKDSLNAFVKGLEGIHEGMWEAPFVGGEQYQQQLLLTPFSIADLFLESDVVLSAFNAFRKVMKMRETLPYVLEDMLVTLPTYEISRNDFSLLGGKSRNKKNQVKNRKTLRKQHGRGMINDEPAKQFRKATYDYVSDLRTATYDFNRTYLEDPSLNKESLLEELNNQVIELNMEYIKKINPALLSTYLKLAPLESSLANINITNTICEFVKSPVFDLPRCPRTVGKNTMASDMLFGRANSKFNEMVVSYIENFSLRVGIDHIVTKAMIIADPELALLNCLRTFQHLIEIMWETEAAKPIVPNTANPDLDFLEPSSAISGGTRKKRRTKRLGSS